MIGEDQNKAGAQLEHEKAVQAPAGGGALEVSGAIASRGNSMLGKARAGFWQRTFSIQDQVLLAYSSIVGLLLLGAAPGPAQTIALQHVLVALSLAFFGCLIARAIPGIPYPIRWMTYRIMAVGSIVHNYVSLRDILPVVRPDSVDAVLLSIDKAIFGVEPALWLERFNQRPIVEWFAFFYFSYFFICGLYPIITFCFTRINRYTCEYAIGTVLTCCIGQLGYMAVPGFGPIHFLADQYQGPVNGGFFWGCVWSTVDAAGALKDIFPSLHTAVPLCFALLALRRAKYERNWLWPARITAFFSFNIIISTVFLRWHYVIDVFAGILLAITVSRLTPAIVDWEQNRRKKMGIAPCAWELR